MSGQGNAYNAPAAGNQSDPVGQSMQKLKDMEVRQQDMAALQNMARRMAFPSTAVSGGSAQPGAAQMNTPPIRGSEE